MDQEKIGIIIKKIRKEHHMSQQDFANKYNVSFQAVSKWETGKNIPDIAIIKKICNDYNLDINSFLDAKDKKNKKFFWLLLIAIVIIIVFFVIINKNNKNDIFEFKTITTSCQNFKVSGSMAYNEKKSSIYISHVDYCGGNDDTKYETISCELMEQSGNNLYLIEKCINIGNDITLENYLKDVSFNIDKYDNSCTRYAKNPLFLIINAKEINGEEKNYSIPLELSNNCK